MQSINVEPVNLIYRLYHDHNGLPLFYSMEKHDGQYIEITQAQFNRANSHVIVIDGQLVEKHSIRPKLVPNLNSGHLCHPRTVALIQSSDQPHVKWDLKYYV